MSSFCRDSQAASRRQHGGGQGGRNDFVAPGGSSRKTLGGCCCCGRAHAWRPRPGSSVRSLEIRLSKDFSHLEGACPGPRRVEPRLVSPDGRMDDNEKGFGVGGTEGDLRRPEILQLADNYLALETDNGFAHITMLQVYPESIAADSAGLSGGLQAWLSKHPSCLTSTIATTRCPATIVDASTGILRRSAIAS